MGFLSITKKRFFLPDNKTLIRNNRHKPGANPSDGKSYVFFCFGNRVTSYWEPFQTSPFRITQLPWQGWLHSITHSNINRSKALAADNSSRHRIGKIFLISSDACGYFTAITFLIQRYSKTSMDRYYQTLPLLGRGGEVPGSTIRTYVDNRKAIAESWESLKFARYFAESDVKVTIRRLFYRILCTSYLFTCSLSTRESRVYCHIFRFLFWNDIKMFVVYADFENIVLSARIKVIDSDAINNESFVCFCQRWN